MHASAGVAKTHTNTPFLSNTVVDKATRRPLQTASTSRDFASVVEAPAASRRLVSRCQYKAPLSLSIVSSLACSLWLVSNLLSYRALAYFCTGIRPMTSVCCKEAKVCPAWALKSPGGTVWRFWLFSTSHTSDRPPFFVSLINTHRQTTQIKKFNLKFY